MGDDDRWRHASAYLYGLALDDPEWAWEFLRRNRRFRRAARPPPEAQAEDLGDWGVHFRAAPGHAGRPRPRRLEAGLAR